MNGFVFAVKALFIVLAVEMLIKYILEFSR